MNELERSRKEINAIDEQMARLFEKRMNECAKIAGYKKEHRECLAGFSLCG